MNLKLVYGTDTGNTVNIIDNHLLIELEKAGFNVSTLCVNQVKSSDWQDHDKFILGVPTWCDGGLQSCWENYFENFKNLSFEGKTFALFGLGDQIGYEEWFCDAIGVLAKEVIKNKGKVIGYTRLDDSYIFKTKPKVMFDENTMYGLALDDDNQQDLSSQRIVNWVAQLKQEF